MAAGLDYYKWRTDEYPAWFRGEVVAWHELSGLVERHVKAVAEKAAEKKGKK